MINDEGPGTSPLTLGWYFPDSHFQGKYCPWPESYIPTAEDEALLEKLNMHKVHETDIWLGLPMYEGAVRGVHCVVSARLLFTEGVASVVWRISSGASVNEIVAETDNPAAAVVMAIVDGDLDVQRREDQSAERYHGVMYDKFAKPFIK